MLRSWKITAAISLKFSFSPSSCCLFFGRSKFFFFPLHPSFLSPTFPTFDPSSDSSRTSTELDFLAPRETRSRWNSARTETNTATRLEHRPTTSLAAELFYRLTGRRSSKSKTRGSRAFLRRMRAFQQERSGGEKRIELEPLVFHPSSRGLDSGFISRNSEGADRLSIRR